MGQEARSGVNEVKWPGGKDFAFSVFDDTDLETVDNVGGVYSFLKESGFLTTKSVWPLSGEDEPRIGGDTCENAHYLDWVKGLQADGFEIALHNVTYHTSSRQTAMGGLERFRQAFGDWPRSMAHHAECGESLYWGDWRLSGIRRFVYNVLTRGAMRNKFRGHVEGDPLFWGDLCRERIRYVRNFVFPGINTLKACPYMPYHDAQRPYVRYWFASSEGATVDSFNKTMCESNQDALEAEHGCCIMYTHFANGFWGEGRPEKRFETLMKRLSGKRGWFVPVSTILDYLKDLAGGHVISDNERRRLETRWLLHKLRVGTT